MSLESQQKSTYFSVKYLFFNLFCKNIDFIYMYFKSFVLARIRSKPASRLPPYPSPGDQPWENITRNISGDNLNIMVIVPVHYELGAEGAHAVAGADVAFILQDR